VVIPENTGGILQRTLSQGEPLAGNEVQVCRFILQHLHQIQLNHLGQLTEISAPSCSGYRQLLSPSDLDKVSTSDARKKADIYLNRTGVSLKQKGSSVLYNRLQRANLFELFSKFGFSQINEKINQIDDEVTRFHQAEIPRDRLWQNFFSEAEFRRLLSYLMLSGSPNYGDSKYPAVLILEAPFPITDAAELEIYSFDEYFNKYQQNLRIAIRRSWAGQTSKHEHKRALSLSRKPENLRWVFNNTIAEPPAGWRTDFPETDRKTVYYLMITKVNS
jgi:hypothetical protein